jgi:hypothetical protein
MDTTVFFAVIFAAFLHAVWNAVSILVIFVGIILLKFF